jgi:hypothetical protein
VRTAPRLTPCSRQAAQPVAHRPECGRSRHGRGRTREVAVGVGGHGRTADIGDHIDRRSGDRLRLALRVGVDEPPAITRFVETLVKRWPDSGEQLDDNSPWAAAPLIRGASGPYVYFGMSYSQADEVSATLV